MAVKIRLARLGKKHAPAYRIVAIDSQKKRDGEYIEDLGTYDPLKGALVQFKGERIEQWVAKGAIVSPAVKKLRRKARKAA